MALQAVRLRSLTTATATATACNKPILIQMRSYSKFDTNGDTFIPVSRRRFIPTRGTYPRNFLAGSINAGIRSTNNSGPDLILVASETPSCGAAVFTKNEFPAPSVTVSKDLLRKTNGRGLRGIVANSGCANLLTGQAGFNDTVRMSQEASNYLCGVNNPEEESLAMVMHTGRGGKRLPIDSIIGSLTSLRKSMGNTHDHWLQAAHGLRTTDTFPKLASRTFTLPSSPNTTFSLAGLTKGSGMVHPNMATTLGIICTDAPISPPALQRLLSAATDKTYNCISIDGDTSTNDMVAMLANGAAGGKEIDVESVDFPVFQSVLTEFMAELAQLVVRDGEGASKFVTIRIRGAESWAAGKRIAEAIAKSVLIKVGFYGKDPNPGGIMVALGNALVDTEFAGKGTIIPELMSVSFSPQDGGQALKVVDQGLPIETDAARIKAVMEQEDLEVVVDLRQDPEGKVQPEEVVYWTCDLTHDFVSLNVGDIV